MTSTSLTARPLRDGGPTVSVADDCGAGRYGGAGSYRGADSDDAAR